MIYKVIMERDKIRFEELVNVLLKEGWELSGGIIIDKFDDFQYLIQALIKKRGVIPYGVTE